MKLNLTPRLTLVFILFASGILMGMGKLVYDNGRAALEAATITELESTVNEKEAAIDNWIMERESKLRALASSPFILAEFESFVESDNQSQSTYDLIVRELAVRTGAGQSFLTLFILSPETGEVILSVDPDEMGGIRADLPYFIEGQTRTYTTPIYFSPDLLVPAMTSSTPILSEEGKLLGVLAGRLNLEELNTIIQRRTGLRQTDDAFLVNTSNLFVTQPRFIPDPAVLKIGVHTEPVQRCLRFESGTMTAMDYRSVSVIASYHWLAKHEMCLIVKITEAEALAPVQAFGLTISWIVAGTLGIASLIAFFLSKAILHPITAMQTAAQRYGRGDWDARLPETRTDELGMLAHEFNQMAASLKQTEWDVQEHARTLEQKVQERTHALQQTLNRLQQAETIAQLGSWELDVASNHVSLSEGLKKLLVLGDDQEDSLEAYFARIHPEDVERMRALLMTCLQKEAPFEVETRILRTDGQIRTFHTRGESFFNKEGKPERLAGVAIDITPRKEVEERIRDLLTFNETILNTVPVGVLTFNISGQCTFANENAAYIIGTTPDRLLAQNFRSLESWKRSGLYELAESAIASGAPVAADVHHISTFGKDIWLTASAVTFKTQHEQQLLLTITDITERKRTEEALRESEDRFKYVFEYSMLGKLIVIVNGEMIANRALCEMLGYSETEFKTKKLAEITHPEDMVISEKVISALLTGKTDAERYVKRYMHKDGHVVWAEVTTSLRREPAGKPIHFMTTVLDITERKQAEEAIQRMTEDLRRSNSELEQFAYVASHDLQEPLRMISSYVQLLAKRYQGKLDSDADEFIAFAVDGAKRMQTLINDLLTYSRVGTRGGEMVPVSAESIFAEAMSNLQFSIEESGARITHDELPVVCGDALQLTMVFQNLIGNAIKFHGTEPPCIHIGSRLEGNEWLFSVQDNGIGIDPQFAERIFIIFQRLNDRTAYPGTGIGLAICKRIILRHGGRIWVESLPGKGATFHFTLPSLDTRELN